jgi:LuxR family maltose regulon positive regulatory protein
MEDNINFIIKVKTIVPNIDEKSMYIRKDFINCLFNEAKDFSFIYIVSPAGFGKTTLMSNISKYYNKFSWLSIDNDDNNLKNFLNYLIFSLKDSEEIVYNKMNKIFNLSKDVPERYLIYKLFEELSLKKEEFTFFIDDFHLINNETILDLIKSSIKYIPSNVRFFISSRDNNLKLVNTNSFTEKILIKNDISFSKNEIEKLILKENIHIDSNSIDYILKKTKGWILGINTALKFNNKDVSKFNYPESITELNNYFLYEVFEKLDLEIQRFLLVTSVIGKFNNHISNFLLDINNSNEIIKKLISSNLFIESIDNLDCFKYHDLFYDFLIKYFKTDDYDGFIKVSKKVSIWYENNNYIDDAIKFSYQSQDKERTLNLIEKKIFMFIDKYFLRSGLEDILKEYDLEHLLEKPIIIIYLAWFNYIETKQFDNAEILIAKLEERYNSFDNNRINSHIYAIKCCLSYFRKKYHEAEFFAKFAIKENPESVLINTYVNLIIASLYIEDDIDNKALEACHRILSLTEDFKVIMLMSQFKRDLLMKQLKYKEAKEECINILDLYKNKSIENYHSILRVYVTLMLISYDKNDFEEFEQVAKKGFEIIDSNKYLLEDKLSIDSKLIFLIAYCYSIIGFSAQIEGLSSIINKIEYDIKILKKTAIYESFIITKINYLFSIDLISEVEALIKLSDLDKTRDPLPVIYLRFLLKKNESSKAQEILEKFLFKDIKHQNQIYCTQALVFQAIIHAKNKHIDEAIFILKQALRKTQHEELITIYTEIDDDMLLLEPFNLLKDEIATKLKNNINISYIDKIINFIKHKQKFKCVSNFIKEEDILSNFTLREKEVFEMLIQDISNKEISKRLFISENTLKTHIKRIYKNLGIKNREQIKIFARINRI